MSSAARVALCVFLFIGCGESDDDGTTSGGKACSSDIDCDDRTPCTSDTCSDGACVNAAVDRTAELAQIPFDCKASRCVDGSAVVVDDDTDVTANPCVDASCNQGMLSSTPKANGVACVLGAGAGICEGGECIPPD